MILQNLFQIGAGAKQSKITFLMFLAAALIVSGFFVSMAFAAVTTLSVSAPNGGEDWRGVRDITWSTTGGASGDLIDIVVIDEGLGFSHEVAADVAYDASPFSWNTATEADGANYKIRILKAGTATVYDTSDTVFEIDNTDPVTPYAIAPVSPNGLNGWYATVPTVTLSCNDGTGSGCNYTYYKWDGAASWTTYTVPFLALEGEHILSFYSDDNATDAVGLRNEETVQTQTIKVDTTVPTVAVTSNTTDGYYNAGDTIDVTLTFSESVSSSDILTVNLDSGGACTIPTFVDQTTVNCIYTVLGGHNSADLTVTTIVPDSGVVEDVAGNDSTLIPTSNMAGTSAIVADTTSPIPFTVGNVTSTGGTVVAGWFNSTNIEVNMLVPIDNDSSLTGGTIQLQAEADGTYEDAGNPYTVLVGFLGNDVSLSLTEAQIEALTGFSEMDNLQFRAIITDRAGNPTTGTESAVSLNVDQTLPSVGAGTDKEVNMTTTQDAIVTDGGSGISTYTWTKETGTGVITFTTPAAEDTDISSDTDGSFTIRLTVTDVAGNSASDDIAFVWDTTDPVLTAVTLVPTPTNDTAPSYTFSVDKAAWLTGNTGTINITGSCGVWTPGTAEDGNNTVTFTGPLPDALYTDCNITVTDAAGNTPGILEINDFEIDTIVAAVSSITTTDANSDGMVDTATIVFTDEMKDSTFVAGDFTIGGVAATTFTTGTADDATVTLSHAGVAGTEAKTVAYTAGTVTDLAGNVRASFSSGSTDEAKPVLLSAKTVATTSIQATFSEDLDGNTVNITGNEFIVAGYAVSGASETAPSVITLTVATMPTDATPDVTYTANGPLNDLAIVPNTAVTPTTVTAVDEVAPTLSSVTISSDNDGDTADPEWAKVGDTATLTFTSSEGIATPIVTIDGMSAIISGGPTAWSAAYTFVGGETDGTVPVSITFADLAVPTPNAGITVTTTDDASTVFFDEVAPEVDAGTDKEVNAVVTQAATVSDPAPASGLATYLWTNQTPGVGTITFGSATAEDTTISADTDGIYTLRLTVTDNAGNSQFNEIIFIWDTTNPEPLTSSPSDGSTGVALTAGTATVTYDEPLVLLDSSKILLVKDSDSASYKGAVAVSGLSPSVLNIDYTGLNYGTKYRINVKPNALEDVAGNNLASNFIAYFTTEIDEVDPVVISANASSITTTSATLNVTTDESATCSYATTDSAYSSMTAFDGPNTGILHTAVLTSLSPATGYDYFVRCADTTAQENTMTISAHVSFTTLTPDTTGPVISNIQTGSIMQTGVTITWTTDEDATDRVEYGLTSSYGSMSDVDTTADHTSHSVSLTGLTAGTMYHFRVLSSDAIPNAETSVDGTFTTSAPDPDTDAPPVPSITTGATSVNSDSYQISGNANADTPTPTARTISLYKGAELVGTAVVPIGQTGWSISVTLTQDTNNSFTAVSTDAFGNVSNASSPVVITEDATVGSDTTPPADPFFTTIDTTVDADTYELTGFAGDDGGVRTIIIKNDGGVVVGTAVLPEGDEDWAIEVVLEQNTSNTFYLTSMDASGNLSNSDDVTITAESTPDITPPVITLLGVNPQTLTVGDSYVELGATAADDVDGDISGSLVIDTSAINMAVAGTYTVTYNVSDLSSNDATEETRTVIVEAAFNDTATLVVTGIDAVRTFATADNTFENGWAWTFHITVPTSETDFTMKFNDFISGANTLMAATNIRYYTAQSSLHSVAGTAVTIAGADTYPTSIILDDDLSASTAGRQIDVVVETRVPFGTPGGSYGTSYGVASGI